ncbi:unnamed protein product, partial [Mesorhabditis belari]|uniref:Uncharacterized protein n=1 Tax=Mesorhabditis belari TaxID=2138241 RepID=A0AAF3F1W0_9BILA
MLDNSSVFSMPDVVPYSLEVKTSSPKKGVAAMVLPIPVRPSRGSSSFTYKSKHGHNEDARYAMDMIENFELNLHKKKGAKERVALMDFSESSTSPSPVSSCGTPTLEKKIQKNTQLLEKLQHQVERRARLQMQAERDHVELMSSNFFLAPPSSISFDRGTPVKSEMEIHRAASSTKILNTQPSTSQLHQQNSVFLSSPSSIEPLVYDKQQQVLEPRLKTLKFADRVDRRETRSLDGINKFTHDHSAQVDISKSTFEFGSNLNRRTQPSYNKGAVDRSVQVYQTTFDTKRKSDYGGQENRDLTLNFEGLTMAQPKPILLKSISDKELPKMNAEKRTSSMPNVRTLPAALGLNRNKTQTQPQAKVFAPPMDVDSIPKKKKMPVSTKRTLASVGFRQRPCVTTRPKKTITNASRKDEGKDQEKSSKKKTFPFIATCVPNQLSHSLTANRHQLLALLKQYLPNHTALRNMVLNITAGGRANVFKSFTTICETEMATLDAKYVKTLDEYERLPDGDELTHELDREMDRFEKEYDALKAVVNKLKSMTSPSRPLTSHTDNGGIVYQMRMIQQAISSSFAL